MRNWHTRRENQDIERNLLDWGLEASELYFELFRYWPRDVMVGGKVQAHRPMASEVYRVDGNDSGSF